MPPIHKEGPGRLRPSWAEFGIIAAGLLILGLQSWVVWHARNNQVHETTRALRNLAGSLLRQAESTIEIADTAVLSLVERLETTGTSAASLAQIDRKLVTQMAEMPRFSSIIVTDASGEQIATSWSEKGAALTDRAYFLHHRDSRERGPFLGDPVDSRNTGTRIITVSRRYDLADGTFAGVIVATIELASFINDYAMIDLGPGSSIALARLSGIGVARQPPNPQWSGFDVSGAAVFRELSRRPSGTFENQGFVDGVSRINGYDSSGRYGLVVVASMSQAHALAAWRTYACLHLITAFVLTSGAGLLGLLLRHQSIRQLGAERRDRLVVQETNASLDRLTRHLARARDDADKASQAKSRFLTGMSHELRTPLNGILGYAELLRMEGGLNERQAARVEAMLGAGNHLLDLINFVLELSEIESGRGARQMARTVPQLIAATCLDLVRPAAENKGLTLTQVIEPESPSYILTDPTRLRQVLINLLGNAVKFTARGGVELRIRKAECGTRLRFEVADTGPGIPAHEVGRLFEEFERLEIDVNCKVEGAGLGLALSARLAALMGGDIGHSANPAGGSVFWLELPIETAGPGQIVLQPDETMALDDPRPFQALRVLVVDDVLMNRDIASAFLQAAGHSVLCAESGAAAIAAVAAADFDVVLMDIRMPEMDGLEATRRIRALDGARGQVAIVALTAQAFTDQVRECREAGMDTHLSKPFNQDALIAVVVRAAGLARARVSSGGLVPGPELRVLNLASFTMTLSCLSPDMVASHLQTIVGLCEGLLRDLDAHAGGECLSAHLADAAHTLAGSAGLFGFERLAGVGREFERAVQSAAPETSELMVGLRAAIGVTIEDIQANRLQAVEN